MPPFHFSSTSRALFRVFVAPNLAASCRTAVSPTHSFFPAPHAALALPGLPLTPIRTKVFKKDTQRHALSDAYTLDTAINSPTINLVDLRGQFHRRTALTSALASLDRNLYHILQVSPGKVDAWGTPDPENPPTCKVISKMDLRQQHKTKLDIGRKQKRGGGAGPSMKNLELNWAIDANDLRHRLEKMKGFLREGRKVEVLLGPKRRGRVATAVECRSVLEKVREAVEESKGAVETKDPDGKVGGVMTLVFEGKVEKVEKRKGQGE
ncbi:uncharacterized protein BDR25DRAFT_300939 [Lindgomyces ingoldianus]|uniref:Uncharacterized protein n=1 Tax=Lindgomyces ingoldianus TaxID=673940 RepID=A0ACB6R746_9PLEO|nr:uncharacterized protein BDR25DRAFT_300939 [Lindgomyces ingoldianus]KAF2475074.1 hypothetical protein BDR25DRAFT_300939 [Lindgomyces ingoldianus]